MSKLSKFMFGDKGSTDKLTTMSPNQEGFQNQLYQILQQIGGGGQGGGGGFQSSLALLMQMLNPGSNQGFEDRYRQQYEDEVEPQLMERFAGAGALGSSGFGQALGAGRAKLESGLADISSQRQQGAIGSILDLYQNIGRQHQGQETFAYRQNPPTTGFLPGLIGMGAKSYFGGF